MTYRIHTSHYAKDNKSIRCRIHILISIYKTIKQEELKMKKSTKINLLTREDLHMVANEYQWETVLIFDFEVFHSDWMVVIKDVFTDDHVILTDKEGGAAELAKYARNADFCFAGFNSSRYDDWIMNAILYGATPAEVKDLSDHIINGGKAWEHSTLHYKKKQFKSCDLSADMGTVGLSLKQIEFVLGMSIKESSVSFDIDRPLTVDEIEDVKKYCVWDVYATSTLFHFRRANILAKVQIGQKLCIPTKEVLKYTNAALTAMLVGARKGQYPRTNTYTPPVELDLNDNANLLDVVKTYDEHFEYTFQIHGVKHVLGLGGLHGAQTNKAFKSNADFVIVNWDVASYYPSLMLEYTYMCLSRAVADINTYKGIYYERLEAKANDIARADALKLILNTMSGAAKDQWNDLYDFEHASNLCITGQLFLIDLLEKIIKLPEATIIQSNTDGIMLYMRRDTLADAQCIVDEWSKRTRMTMECDLFNCIYQRDVNCYVAEKENGKVKAKGGYLKYYGLYSDPTKFKAEDKLKRTMPLICSKALAEYLLYGTPIATTIKNGTLEEYALLCKAGGNYKACYHKVDGEYVELQKVNRVYAVAGRPELGGIYKQKKGNDTFENVNKKLTSCIVDNTGELTMEDIRIDYSYYYGLVKADLGSFGK